MGYVYEDPHPVSPERKFDYTPANWMFFLNTRYNPTEVKNKINAIMRNNNTPQIKIREHNVDYRLLKQFLKLDENGNIQNKYLNEIAEIEDKYFGTDFKLEFRKCKEKFFKKEYSSAMRDLRALIQASQTKICDKFNIDPGEKPDITNLAGKLKSNGAIRYEVHNQLLAFASIGNYSSHGVFPTSYDLENRIVNNKFFITFYLGCYLLKELENAIK
jgi:hypothetical protein